MEIEAAAGRPFELVIEQHATSGYRWQVEAMPAGVRQEGEDRASGPAGAPGSPERRAMRFVADQPGDYEIVLALKRAWESEPIERKTIRAHVRA